MENRKSGEVTSLHDIKEVSKRTFQFGVIALAIASALVPVRYFFGHTISAALLFAFCIFIAFVLVLYKRGFVKHTKLVNITGINLFLVLFVYADGLRLGGYLFFFPLFFAIPFLVDHHARRNKEVLFCYVFTGLCVLASFLLSSPTSPWQNISAAEYRNIFGINVFCAVTLSASFSLFCIYFEKRYSQALLKQKDKTEDAMKTRTQFLSHMGHELRTPLNGIIGATNLLARGKTLTEQEEYLNILKYCSNHMLDLINNILDYNKIEADKLDIHLTETNLKQLVQNSLLPFYNRFEEKNIELQLEIDEKLEETVLADDIRLTQILNNLVSNALKFTEHGSVKLKAKCRNKNDSALEVIFAVEDTGIGICKEDFKKIFESFEQVYTESTRKYHGTGLGLTISQRLLKLMDSKLELESEKGKGSTFSFAVSFRKAEGQQLKQAGPTKVEKADLSGMRVLIAEDNLINMLIATKMLEDWNVNFTTAENGKEALKALKKDSNYNLILMDLEMPEMDGYTAVKEIIKLYPEVPVVAFTATLVDHEMYDNLKHMGFVDAMLKPFQPMELFSKIRYYAA